MSGKMSDPDDNKLSILKSKKEYDPLSDNLTEEAIVPPERNKRLSFSNLKSTKKDVDNDNDETRNRRVSFSNLRVVKEFAIDSEKNTVWNDTYEEPVHSSASTVSTDNTESYSKQNTTFATMLPMESADKENMPMVLVEQPLDLTMKPTMMLAASTPLIRPMSVLKNMPISKIQNNLNQTANDDDMELTGIIIPSINCSQPAIGSSKTTTTTTTIANFVDKSFNATNPDMELTCVLDDQKMSNNQSIDEAQIDDCNQTSKLINISNVDMEITGLNGSDQDTASPVPLVEPLIPCAVPFTAPHIEIPTGSVHEETLLEVEEEEEKVDKNVSVVNESPAITDSPNEIQRSPIRSSERGPLDHEISILARQTENMHLSASSDISLMESIISSQLSSSFYSFVRDTDHDNGNNMENPDMQKTEQTNGHHIYKDVFSDTFTSSREGSFIANEKFDFLVSHSGLDHLMTSHNDRIERYENILKSPKVSILEPTTKPEPCPERDTEIELKPKDHIGNDFEFGLKKQQTADLVTDMSITQDGFGYEEPQQQVPKDEIELERESEHEPEPKIVAEKESMIKTEEPCGKSENIDDNREEREFEIQLENVESVIEKSIKRFTKHLNDSALILDHCAKKNEQFKKFQNERLQIDNFAGFDYGDNDGMTFENFWSMPLNEKCRLFCSMYKRVKVQELNLIENWFSVRLYGICFLLRLQLTSDRQKVQSVLIEHIISEKVANTIKNEFYPKYLMEQNVLEKLPSTDDIFKYFAFMDSDDISTMIIREFRKLYLLQ